MLERNYLLPSASLEFAPSGRFSQDGDHKSGAQMPVVDPAALPSPAQSHRQGPAGRGDRDPQPHVHHCGSNKALNTGSSETNAFLVQASAFSFCRINTCVHVTHVCREAGLQPEEGRDRTG